MKLADVTLAPSGRLRREGSWPWMMVCARLVSSGTPLAVRGMYSPLAVVPTVWVAISNVSMSPTPAVGADGQ